MNAKDGMLYELIGQRIKMQRQSLSFTQAQLAEQVEITRTSITNIEAGLQKLPLHLLYRICNVLELDVKEVLPSLDEIAGHEKVTVDYEGGKSQQMKPRTAFFVREVLEDMTSND